MNSKVAECRLAFAKKQRQLSRCWTQRKHELIRRQIVSGEKLPKRLEIYVFIWLSFPDGSPREQIKMLRIIMLLNKICAKIVRSLLELNAWVLPSVNYTSPISSSGMRCVRYYSSVHKVVERLWKSINYSVDMTALQRTTSSYVLNLWIAWKVFSAVKSKLGEAIKIKFAEDTNKRNWWTVNEFVDQQHWALIRKKQSTSSWTQYWNINEDRTISTSSKLIGECLGIKKEILKEVDNTKAAAAVQTIISETRGECVSEPETLIFSEWIQDEWIQANSKGGVRGNHLRGWVVWVSKHLDTTRPLCSQLLQLTTTTSPDLSIDQLLLLQKQVTVSHLHLQSAAFARSSCTLSQIQIFCAGCSIDDSKAMISYPINTPHYCKNIPSWSDGTWIHWIFLPFNTCFPIPNFSNPDLCKIQPVVKRKKEKEKKREKKENKKKRKTEETEKKKPRMSHRIRIPTDRYHY